MVGDNATNNGNGGKRRSPILNLLVVMTAYIGLGTSRKCTCHLCAHGSGIVVHLFPFNLLSHALQPFLLLINIPQSLPFSAIDNIIYCVSRCISFLAYVMMRPYP